MDDRAGADAGGPQREEADSGQPQPPRPPQRPDMSARAAAYELGVDERTVRRWIDQGQLAAAKVRGSYRIAPDEIERARIVLLGEGLGGTIIDIGAAASAGTPGIPDMSGHDRTAAAAADPPGAVAVSPAARGQLEAIRDEWLRPLVDDLRAAERTIGRLEAERDAAIRERDDLAAQLRAARDAPTASPGPPGATERPGPGTDAPDSWWRRVWWLRDRDRD